MSSSEIAIQVLNLSKQYEIYDRPRDRLKQFIFPKLQKLFGKAPVNYCRDIWVLKDLSFELKRGETIGIIGRNGSGKSTLLQIICGMLSPTHGQVRVNGRIAALLELGSGFNPEFTGRENVYLNASVLGLSKSQIDERFEDIIKFADIDGFIEQSVKTYSSGMVMRLAFSVIAHVDADILIVDEALSVGDVFFTQKCMRFIKKFQSQGGSIIFVSHDMASVVSLCTRALLLSSAAEESVIIGDPQNISKIFIESAYQVGNIKNPVSTGQVDRFNAQKIEAKDDIKSTYFFSEFNVNAQSFGSRNASILDVEIFNQYGIKVNRVESEERVGIKLVIKAKSNIESLLVGVMLKDRLGQYIYTASSDGIFFGEKSIVMEVGQVVRATFNFDMPVLNTGDYSLNVAIANGVRENHQQMHWIHDAIRFECASTPLAHGISGFANTSITFES